MSATQVQPKDRLGDLPAFPSAEDRETARWRRSARLTRIRLDGVPVAFAEALLVAGIRVDPVRIARAVFAAFDEAELDAIGHVEFRVPALRETNDQRQAVAKALDAVQHAIEVFGRAEACSGGAAALAAQLKAVPISSPTNLHGIAVDLEVLLAHLGERKAGLHAAHTQPSRLRRFADRLVPVFLEHRATPQGTVPAFKIFLAAAAELVVPRNRADDASDTRPLSPQLILTVATDAVQTYTCKAQKGLQL